MARSDLFRLTGTCILVLTLTFVQKVANRCSGEADWTEGVHLCACTVASRLKHGWTEDNVLTAYYAPDSTGASDPALLEAAAKGLDNQACPADAYYLFEPASVKALGLSYKCSTAKTERDGKRVDTFRYNTLKDKRCHA